MEQLWTVDDLAERLKVKSSWVYQQVHAGTLPCLKVGHLLRFEPSAIEAFLARNRKGPKMNGGGGRS